MQHQVENLEISGSSSLSNLQFACDYSSHSLDWNCMPRSICASPKFGCPPTKTNDLACLLAVAILWNISLHHYLLFCGASANPHFSCVYSNLCHLNPMFFSSSTPIFEEPTCVTPRVAPQNKDSSKKVVTAGRKA